MKARIQNHEESVSQDIAPKERTLTGSILNTLVRSIFFSILLTFLMILLTEAIPHSRGIGFPPELRISVLFPICIGLSILNGFLYQYLKARSKRPKIYLAFASFAQVFLIGLILFIRNVGFLLYSIPVLTGAFLSVVWILPFLIDRIRFSLRSKIVIFIIGGLELISFVSAVSLDLSAPSSPEVTFEIPKTIFDAEQKFIDLPSGARIHYVDEGGGEILLFLHGNPSWSYQWRDLISGLKGSYRCIALDYPGFGQSIASKGFGFTPKEESIVLEEFVHILGLKDLTLVMQDWGGPIGLGFAGRHPKLVKRMILGSTWAWKTDPNSPRGIFSFLVGGPIGEFFQINFNAFSQAGIKNGIVRKLPTEEMDLYIRPFLPSGQRRGIAAFYPGQITQANDYFQEIEDFLSKLKEKPALIFWALQDKGFPIEERERFETVFPNHKTIEFPNADHFFFEDTKDEMIPEIKEFLSAHPVRE
ncbi:alpha/beta fold hydrolase [Leptospira semungkisensis]|uniref:Alpha/beta fold hydrolase n=1 Tax=Leptospira semungkisensis TaxID=2484985 RepID=A0A4R9FLR3_9LEPT|nr:alpha/beta fold hydrolase [Leptospira semungkisensis]TGJ99517.1 alpha/beta fold hydrolase [Leptospira semungkisensis]